MFLVAKSLHAGQRHFRPECSGVRECQCIGAPLDSTTSYVSALFQSAPSTRWDVFTFGTDSSLKTGPGWDNVTEVGTPNGVPFIQQVVAPSK
jgi:hypothetical protein